MSEAQSRACLAPFGLPFNAAVLADDAEGAVAAAAGLGYPVALKGDHPDAAHKTELGLVALGLADAAAVRAAAALIRTRLPPDGRLSVQAMVGGRRALIAGFLRDPVFGPCVSIGIGGIFAEAIGDIAFRTAPLSLADAEDALDDLAHPALLGPFRGEPAADRAAIAALLVALGQAGTSRGDIAAIDINPIRLEGGRPVAVDALVVLAEPGDWT